MHPEHDDTETAGALQALRQAGTSPAGLARLARDRQLMRGYEAKRLLCVHPRTPLPLARRFLPHLRWRDLARLAADAAAHPSLRASAETRLAVRLPELTTGEKISFARMATRPLIQTLLESPDARVLGALLRNPRACEADVRQLATSASVPPRLLERVLEDPSWGGRLSIRAALAANPRTPAHHALRALEGLDAERLSALARDERARELVRVGARRRLAAKVPA